MKSYRNYKEIKRKETMGRRLSMAGLGILFVGLMASFVPTWLPPDQPATTPLTQFLQQYWTWISFAALPWALFWPAWAATISTAMHVAAGPEHVRWRGPMKSSSAA